MRLAARLGLVATAFSGWYFYFYFTHSVGDSSTYYLNGQRTDSGKYFITEKFVDDNDINMT